MGETAAEFRVFQATPADTPLIADIRLRALRDTPEAFLTRYEDCPAPGHVDWYELVTQWTRPPDNVVFVATWHRSRELAKNAPDR